MARGTILTKVTKDGTKRYRTIIRINGKQQWRTWDRKRDAENYLDELSPDVRDHSYREIRKATFGEYAEHFKETYLIPEKFKPDTYNGYCSILEHHLLPEFRQYPLQAISPAEINRFSAKLLQRELSGKTVRNILTLLGEILSKAVTESYLKHSPMEGVDKPRIDKEQKGRALKPDEIQSILKACDEDLQLMFATAVATGLRRGEQFGLDLENVDFENNVIRVRRALYWKFGKYHKRQEGEPSYVFVSPKSKKSNPGYRYVSRTSEGIACHLYEKRPQGPGVLYVKGNSVESGQCGKAKFRPGAEAGRGQASRGGLAGDWQGSLA